MQSWRHGDARANRRDEEAAGARTKACVDQRSGCVAPGRGQPDRGSREQRRPAEGRAQPLRGQVVGRQRHKPGHHRLQEPGHLDARDAGAGSRPQGEDPTGPGSRPPGPLAQRGQGRPQLHGARLGVGDRAHQRCERPEGEFGGGAGRTQRDHSGSDSDRRRFHRGFWFSRGGRLSGPQLLCRPRQGSARSTGARAHSRRLRCPRGADSSLAGDHRRGCQGGFHRRRPRHQRPRLHPPRRSARVRRLQGLQR